MIVADDQQFLGTGWGFPVTFSNQGRSVTMAEAADDIQQSLQILLSTQVGERVMQPTFGWKREALVFEPLSSSFATFLASEIQNAILFFEPRIDLNQVSFDNAADTAGLVLLRLDYTIRSTNTRTNLVYPFYLDEATNA
jgi:uncharacterized protein